MPRAVGLGLKLLVSGLLLAIIAWKVGPAALLATLRRLDTEVLILALVLTVGFILGRSAKWMLLARAALPGLTFRESVVSLMGGMGLGMITPGRAGEFTRVAFLPGGDRLTLIGLFAVDRVMDLQTIALFGMLALPLLGYGGYFAIALAVCSISIGCLYVARRAQGPLIALAQRLPLRRFTVRLLAALEGLSPGRITAALLVGIGATLIGYGQFFVLLRPYADLPLAAVVLTFSIMILSNLLPITIGGLGVREALSVLLLRRYGVSDAVAVNAAFLSYLTNTVLPGIVGSFLLPRVRVAAPTAAPPVHASPP
jgi:uncharacterized membrane protein YbhN (UPF0104 family)